MEKFTTLTGIARLFADDQCRHRHDHPQAISEDHQAHRARAGLFAELRYDEAGKPKPDFVLHKPPYDNAKILIAGDNFGCGSSREHAPWALLDFGFRCIIAPSFADIFYNNCFKNGILPITLPQSEIDKLIDDASRGANATITVDLEPGDQGARRRRRSSFDIDPFLKRCLMEGLDDIGADAGEGPAHRRLRDEVAHAPPLGLIA